MPVSGQLNALITSAPELGLFEDQWAPEPVHGVKAYGEIQVELQSFLSLALVGGDL